MVYRITAEKALLKGKCIFDRSVYIDILQDAAHILESQKHYQTDRSTHSLLIIYDLSGDKIAHWLNFYIFYHYHHMQITTRKITTRVKKDMNMLKNR